MTRYVLRRLLQSAVLLALVVTAVFVVFQVMPGDVTAIFIQPDIPPEARQALIAQLGLDRPAHERYLAYLGGLVRLDLGRAFPTPTFQGGRPITAIIGERLPRTVLLFLVVVVANYALGFTLGKLIAWRRGRWSEYAATVTGVTLLNVFTPVAALFFLWLFALQLRRFPFGGWQDYALWQPFFERGLTSNHVFVPMLVTGILLLVWILCLWRATRDLDHRRARAAARAGGLAAYGAGTLWWWDRAGLGVLALDVLHHMTLPVLTLVTLGFAGSMLVMRDSMLETMREDYVLTARAKGLPDRAVRDRHAARTALLPIATSFALAVALVVDGAVITEMLFSWPGMGHALLNSVLEQNFPVTMGVVLVLAVAVLLAHLLVDLLYAWLDPRIRYD
jgi:peptide/nickel transport system permease protein